MREGGATGSPPTRPAAPSGLLYRRSPLGAALLYAVAGMLWIFATDHLLGWLSWNPRQTLLIEGLKGVLFVLATAAIGFVLLRRAAVREAAAEALRLEQDRRLHRTVALLSATLDTSDDGILVVDLQGGVLAHNRKFRELTGLTDEQIEASDMLSLRPHVLPLYRDAARVTAFADRLMADPESSDEDSFDLVDGRILERRSVPFRVAGEIVGRVWSYRDVTERQRAEVAVRESESRFRLMVEGSEAVFFYRHDLDGVYQYLSPSVRAVLGYEPEELLGRRSREFLLADDEARQAVGQRTRQAIESGQPVAAYSADNRRKDGSLVTLEITEAPVVAEGRVVGIAGFARDVTDRRRLEAELRQAQKMEAVGRLAGGVAHDFNNILTVVTGCAHMALEQAQEPEVARLLREIGTAADRAAGLTRQLLAFSRKQVIEPRAVDLNALLQRTESLLRRVIGEDVVLAVTPASEPAATWADPGQVEQVLMNLAVNARDAMPHGGTIRIAVARRRAEAPPEDVAAGEFVVLEVADEGVGIPQDVLPRIFDPFFTTKEVGGGTGLGLATVYGILRQAGGWVDVESAPGGGARFRAWFPAYAGAEEPAPAPRPSPELPRGRERILVVEDEIPVRALVRRVLERLGYFVLEAGNGAEGMEVLGRQQEPVDLVLSDVVMPGMSGPEFLLQCRQLSPASRLALMSGYADDRLPGVGGHREFPVVAKPFEPAHLARVIRALLDAAPGETVTVHAVD